MGFLIRILLLSLCLVVTVATCHAYSKFKVDCSGPSHSVNFVSSPNFRGTLDILWSSLFTLLTCTWTIQHLNVPEQRDPARDKSFWSDVQWTLKGVWRNLKWMMITMVAPEYIFGKAFGDLCSALRTRTRLQGLAKDDNVEWSLEHSFFADMGGFVGVCEDDPLDENGEVDKMMARPLKAEQIYWLRTNERSGEDGRKKLEKLPDITKEELLDKSKGDIFVKTITATQDRCSSEEGVGNFSAGIGRCCFLRLRCCHLSDASIQASRCQGSHSTSRMRTGEY